MSNILSYIAEASPALRGVLSVIVILGVGFILYFLWETVIELPGRANKSKSNGKGG